MGAYVLFWDSDDTQSSSAIEKLVECSHGFDGVSVCAIRRMLPDGKERDLFTCRRHEPTPEEAFDEWLRGGARSSSIELLRILSMFMIMLHHLVVHNVVDYKAIDPGIFRFLLQFFFVSGGKTRCRRVIAVSDMSGPQDAPHRYLPCHARNLLVVCLATW